MAILPSDREGGKEGGRSCESEGSAGDVPTSPLFSSPSGLEGRSLTLWLIINSPVKNFFIRERGGTTIPDNPHVLGGLVRSLHPSVGTGLSSPR
ncbi:hypothetical protein OPV22_004561 [Ensete ventricosum]|uniref:Uncharacterized protein n=1 Tax=Ensete ventricosum TaxID=4639 RepID=A0AAV8RM16_ENSVE|nr:hypothetical protein OPV22_004561 [Ensete ventricosum]